MDKQSILEAQQQRDNHYFKELLKLPKQKWTEKELCMIVKNLFMFKINYHKVYYPPIRNGEKPSEMLLENFSLAVKFMEKILKEIEVNIPERIKEHFLRTYLILWTTYRELVEELPKDDPADYNPMMIEALENDYKTIEILEESLEKEEF